MFVKSNIPNSNSQEDALDLTLRPKNGIVMLAKKG